MCIILFLALASPATEAVKPTKAVVLVVDPAWDDTAGYVSKIPLLSKFKIIKVMTRLGKTHSFLPGHFTPYKEFTFQSETPDNAAASAEICPQLQQLEKDIPIEAVIPTSDGAVSLTDMLAECLGKRGNPASGPLAAARRNKWVMHKAMRRAGLRTMREKVVSSWDEAQTYLKTWSPPLSPENPCVFKILQGSGGDGTVQVDSMEQAFNIFDKLVGSTDATADVNTQVLIQEFLVGKEYAIDSVSRDGIHKVVAVWMEDFRPANGIFDQYFGFKLMNPDHPKIKAIINYGTQILEATGLENGAANTEIKWLDNEEVPCLMEINARWAGINWGDGLTVEDVCVGKNIIEAAFESYLDQDAFDSWPVVRPILQHGGVIFTINYQAGILKAIPGLEAAKKMPSYYDSDIDSAQGLAGMKGKELALTTPNSIPVCIALVSKDPHVIDADYDRLIQMQTENKFFDISPVMLTGSLATSQIRLSERRLPVPLAFAMLSLVGMTVFIVYFSKQESSTPGDYITLE